MVQLEAGSAFWNSSRPMGSQASGLTGRSRAISGLNMRAKNRRSGQSESPAECPPALPDRSPPRRAAVTPARSSRCPYRLARRDRTDRQTGSCAESSVLSGVGKPLLFIAASCQSHHQQPQPQQRRHARAVRHHSADALTAGVVTTDLQRRQDNHFAGARHAARAVVVFCRCCILRPLYGEWRNGWRTLPGRSRSRRYRPSACCCDTVMTARRSPPTACGGILPDRRCWLMRCAMPA